jgi:hypothetical protein
MPTTPSRRAASGRLRATPRAPWWLPATTGGVATTIPLLVAAVLAGCSGNITVGRGGPDMVDPAKTAGAVTRYVTQQVPGLQVGSVACPSGVKLTAGVSFQCTADIEGAHLPITVTVTHVDIDKGEYDYTFKPAKALIDTEKVVNELRSNLPDKVNFEPTSATVDCGTPRLRVVAVGGSIECTISKGSERHVVRAVVEDVAGTAHFELADQPPARPKVATGKIGDRLTVYDEFGDAQLEVTVSRIKFSTGDELERPQRGLYLGAYVKGHALADEQYFFDIYARVGGHLYETAITGTTGFDPPLEPEPLNKGERASGWLIFDVPSRHGQLVLRDLDEHTVALWKY